MKTTFLLPDKLMQQLKELAARESRSLSSVVQDAVHQYLAQPIRPVDVPPLPVFDGGGLLVDVSNRDALYDALDQTEP